MSFGYTAPAYPDGFNVRCAVHSVSTAIKRVTLPANAIYARICGVATAPLQVYGTQPYAKQGGTAVGAASVTVGAVSAGDPKPSYVLVPINVATVTFAQFEFPCSRAQGLICAGSGGKSIVRIEYLIGAQTAGPSS